MKHLLSFLIASFLCFACNDALDLTSINKDLENRNADISPQGIIVPAPTYQWYELPNEEMNSPAFDYEQGRLFKCNGNVYARAGVQQYNTYKLNISTKRWDLHPVDLNQFYSSYFILFCHGSYLYGLSSDGQNRVGAINVNTGDFILRSSFPGVSVSNFAAVTIGDNGYLLGGTKYLAPGNYTTPNQFWKFDFVRNQWTDLGALPGGGRAGGSAFVVEDKIYFGLGYQYRNINNTWIRTYKKDWLAIDPNSGNYFITRANFPGEPRQQAQGFVINNKIYLGWGDGEEPYETHDDFWEFNSNTNTWTQKTTLQSVKDMHCFSKDNIGYALRFGSPGQFWQYRTSTTVNMVP